VCNDSWRIAYSRCFQSLTLSFVLLLCASSPVCAGKKGVDEEAKEDTSAKKTKTAAGEDAGTKDTKEAEELKKDASAMSDATGEVVSYADTQAATLTETASQLLISCSRFFLLALRSLSPAEDL
jgi:hypothetical protein